MIKDAVNIIQMAACYLQLHKYSQAEQILLKHSGNGNSAEINYYLGLTYSLQGKYNEAIKILTSSLSSGQGSSSSKELIFQLLINKANKVLQNGDDGSLSEILTTAIKYLPDKPEYAKLLSHFDNILPVSYIKNGEREKAAKIWMDKLVQKSFSNTEITHNLALLYYWWALSNENEISDSKGSEKSEKRISADFLWSQTIMYWFSFISSQAYWEKFCADRSSAWEVEVTPDMLKSVKSEISRDKLLKELEKLLDKYQGKEPEDYFRIQNYIVNYHFEKRMAAYWAEFHEIVFKNQKSFGNENAASVKKIVTVEGPYTLSFILKYFTGQKLYEEVLNLTTVKLSSDKDNELLENIRLSFKYPDLGKIILVLRELKDTDLSKRLWEELKITEGKSGLPLKSPEAQLVLALMSFNTGIQSLTRHDFFITLKEWKVTAAHLKIASEVDKQKNCKILLSKLTSHFKETVAEESIKSARKYNAANKINEAIEILETGYDLAGTDEVRDLLCGNYCEKAQTFLKEKTYSKANELFEKALKLDRNYIAAKRGLSISLNNEGMAELNKNNFDKAIRLLERAIDLDKDDVVTQNLASAYNAKAVNILDNLSSYSSSSQCDPAIDLLTKAIKLLNPDLDVKTFSTTFMFMEEYMFNSLVANISEGSYKTMLRNLWIAVRSKKNLRGY
jgi:tetratricopeptide (TPR) repeat protein